MSCLSKNYRLKSQKDFNTLYKSGKKWHTHSFVAFFKSNNNHFNIAFVASKKIGNAVSRNRAKRRLRAVFLEYENKIQKGSYIFIVKEALNTRDFKGIKKDFDFAFKRLELFKSKND